MLTDDVSQPEDEMELSETPLPSKTTFSDSELEYFKQLLLKRRNDTVDDIERLNRQLKEAREQTEYDTASSSDMAEDAGDAMELEKMYLLVARQKKYLNDLDRALERIRLKTYGICKVTGKTISKERLEAVPHTQVCIEVKNKRAK